MNVRIRIALSCATLAAVTGVAATSATSAVATAASPNSATSAVTCSKWKSISADHNSVGVRYMECDRKVGGRQQTSAALYIWDNKTDGKYARVNVATGYAHWNGLDQTWFRYYSWTSTRHHSPKYETGWHSGNDVEVLLKAVRG
ncbi:hypothetical protein ACFZDP_20960 [Streptomyces mirabilis]|jgi:hypothetical protein|uniref:hypothetical protein n=1 Tax=Streptomyces mirabilis TaxID=68239 RepID=UPI0006BA7263|nr:hypothetical protein OK006_1168 [Actinobacteria bacterium OK006]